MIARQRAIAHSPRHQQSPGFFSRHMRWTGFLTVAAMSMSSTQSGCSVFLVKAPPSPDEPIHYSAEDGLACMEMNTAPRADVFLAPISGLLITLQAAGDTPTVNQTAQQRQNSEARGTVIFLSGLAVAGVFTLSALWGFRKTRKCREYFETPRTRRSLRLQRQAASQAEVAGDQ